MLSPRRMSTASAGSHASLASRGSATPCRSRPPIVPGLDALPIVRVGGGFLSPVLASPPAVVPAAVAAQSRVNVRRVSASPAATRAASPVRDASDAAVAPTSEYDIFDGAAATGDNLNMMGSTLKRAPSEGFMSPTEPARAPSPFGRHTAERAASRQRQRDSGINVPVFGSPSFEAPAAYEAPSVEATLEVGLCAMPAVVATGPVTESLIIDAAVAVAAEDTAASATAASADTVTSTHVELVPAATPATPCPMAEHPTTAPEPAAAPETSAPPLQVVATQLPAQQPAAAPVPEVEVEETGDDRAHRDAPSAVVAASVTCAITATEQAGSWFDRHTIYQTTMTVAVGPHYTTLGACHRRYREWAALYAAFRDQPAFTGYVFPPKVALWPTQAGVVASRRAAFDDLLSRASQTVASQYAAAVAEGCSFTVVEWLRSPAAPPSAAALATFYTTA